MVTIGIRRVIYIVVIMPLDMPGCRHMICCIPSRLLRISLMMIRAAIIMVVGVVMRTITGEVGRVEGLGLGMISMTSITVDVDLFYVLVSLVSSLVIIACQDLFFSFLFFCLSISTLILILILFKLGVAWIRRYPFFSGVQHD